MSLTPEQRDRLAEAVVGTLRYVRDASAYTSGYPDAMLLQVATECVDDDLSSVVAEMLAEAWDAGYKEGESMNPGMGALELSDQLNPYRP